MLIICMYLCLKWRQQIQSIRAALASDYIGDLIHIISFYNAHYKFLLKVILYIHSPVCSSGELLFVTASCGKIRRIQTISTFKGSWETWAAAESTNTNWSKKTSVEVFGLHLFIKKTSGDFVFWSNLLFRKITLLKRNQRQGNRTGLKICICYFCIAIMKHHD